MRSHLLGKHISNKDLGLLALGLFCFLVAGIIHHNVKKPLISLNKQDTAINVNKDILIFMSAGNKRLLADALWIQTLLESDIDHYSKSDMKNWMYLRFQSIASLDPLFYQNYIWGGQYLSIIKDDLQGAVSLLEEGLKVYPDDYRLNYLAGFTYYHELGDYDKGIKYLEKIMNHPQTPFYIKTLIIKMRVEKGFNIDSSLGLIKNQIEQTQEENLKLKLSRDFYSLKAERDLKCLNAIRINCELSDAEGRPYIKNGNTYYSPRSFVPYRLKKKGDFSQAEPVNTIR